GAMTLVGTNANQTVTNAAGLVVSPAIKSTNVAVTNTHGILIPAIAVSTATNAYGLTVNAPTGATNNYAAAFLGGNVGIGTTAPSTKLEITGSTTASGATAIASQLVNSTLTNGTGSGFQFGVRHLVTVDGATAGTETGNFIRVTDSTSLANTVRGLEIQAWSGTNTTGVNTGILSQGKTFGVHAVTDALAGGTLAPAAVFADLDNGSAATVGNAIRAYTNNATSANLVSFYQETTTFTGAGLVMNFGNSGGGFTGNFLELQKAGTSKLTIDDTGRVDVLVADADNAIAVYINTEESTVTQSVFALESDTTGNGQSADTVKAHFEADGSLFISLTGTQTLNALCHTGTGQTNNDEIVDCSGAPSDLAEAYGTTDPTIGPAELVAVVGEAQEVEINGFKTSKAWVERSSTMYQSTLIGVVSTQPNQVYAEDAFVPEENPRPIAIAGRVPVKVNLENGPIHTGDLLTSSSVPGEAMKATAAGMVVGQALSSYDGSTPYYQYVVVKVDPFFYDPANVSYELVDGMRLQRATETQALFAQTDGVAYLINQQGSGDLLQLQADGVDRLLVKNNGAVLVNTTTTEPSETLISVKSAEADVFTLNARGDVSIAGNIIVTDSSYAGSIATNANGLAEVQFTNHLGTGKPSVQITPEGEQVVLAQVSHWMKDENQNYRGVVIKASNLDGTPASTIVHYVVVGKPAGYETQGQIVVLSAPLPPPAIEPEGSETAEPLAEELPQESTLIDEPVEESEEAETGSEPQLELTTPPESPVENPIVSEPNGGEVSSTGVAEEAAI
ncbi:MAG: hypothetical protein Q8P77_01625, partial [Candidatus Veblenbacteria bacterium]|nr:hypothetical protein [Candidatus Veblenbacteria bacterium]